MKRIVYSLLGGLTLSFACCTQDLNAPIFKPTEDTIAINIDGSINQASTRADASGFCNGDAVGIYAVNYDSETPGTMVVEGNQADNVRFIFNFDEYRWIPDYDIYYKDDHTAVDLIGYYLYNSNIEMLQSIHSK